MRVSPRQLRLLSPEVTCVNLVLQAPTLHTVCVLVESHVHVVQSEGHSETE